MTDLGLWQQLSGDVLAIRSQFRLRFWLRAPMCLKPRNSKASGFPCQRLSRDRNWIRSRATIWVASNDEILAGRQGVLSAASGSGHRGEAVVAFKPAKVLLDKFGGDSVREFKRNLASYREASKRW
jgi:hypothetical protein